MSAADHLAQIRARAEAATPGRWGWVRLEHWSEWADRALVGVRPTPGRFAQHEVLRVTHGCVPSPADATFIAHAREDIPALLAAVEAVLALHQPHYLTHDRTKGINQEFCCARAQLGGISWCECEGCGDCEIPCPTVRAITEALA